MNNTFSRIFFNLWYLFKKPPWDTGISPPELLAYLDSHTPGRALDLGCGTGANLVSMAQRGWQVTGVDFAVKAISAARRKARQAGVKVELHVADVTRIDDIHGPFDLILDIGCFHNLDQGGKLRYLANLVRLLAPQGAFLLYAFSTTGDSDATTRSGITPADVERLNQTLRLIQRLDGSERGLRPSAWFMYTTP
jgi:cyclopropane fatty-acyl-phospholipid synthase-like methyltransferase